MRGRVVGGEIEGALVVLQRRAVVAVTRVCVAKRLQRVENTALRLGFRLNDAAASGGSRRSVRRTFRAGPIGPGVSSPRSKKCGREARCRGVPALFYFVLRA